jgi:hypothetical protein
LGRQWELQNRSFLELGVCTHRFNHFDRCCKLHNMPTPAIKTPLLREALDRLSALNDQLCYFTFVEEEFERRLTQVDSEAQDLYTTQVFTNNSRAHRIYVKIKDLSAFQRETKSAALGAFASGQGH